MAKELICQTEAELFGSVEKLSIYATTYADGNYAVVAESYDDDFGCDVPYGKVSVNVPGDAHRLQEGEFFAKAYSEGLPLYNHLLSQGLIEYAGWGVFLGHSNIPVMRFTDKAKGTFNG
ncbi:MAG: hypothetical protein AB7C95_00655 [Synergistaceae bacterium]